MPEVAPVSRLEFPGGPVRDGHVHAVLLETVFEPVTGIRPNIASCPAMGCAVVSYMGIGQVSGSLQGILGPAIKTRSRHVALLVAYPTGQMMC
jgi:hypothetical protein